MNGNATIWNPNDLRYFLEIARTLNISRAAERLGVGQPAVSQAVQRLEAYFGTQLLDRYKTGVKLTEAGARLNQAGAQTLESCVKLKDEVLASENRIQGSFIIGCHPSVGIYSLPIVLPNLLRENPELSIRLAHGLSREILEGVVSFKIDFGIVVNPARHPDLVIKELCRDQVTFWGTSKSIKDTLIYDPSLIQSQALLSKMKAIKFKRFLESSNLEVIASLAEAHAGIAVLPTRVAKRVSGLHPFKKDFPHFEDQICLVYRADRHLSTAASLVARTLSHAEI